MLGQGHRLARRLAVNSLKELLEALLSPLAWLLQPFIFPVLLGLTAWGTVRWSRRRRKQDLPAPLFTQPWAWIGWTVVGAYTFIVVGFAFFAWKFALILAAVLVVPLGVIALALLRA